MQCKVIPAKNKKVCQTLPLTHRLNAMNISITHVREREKIDAQFHFAELLRNKEIFTGFIRISYVTALKKSLSRYHGNRTAPYLVLEQIIAAIGNRQKQSADFCFSFVWFAN
jgi:hypothetical protein